MGIIRELAKLTKEAIVALTENATDEVALKAVVLYESWNGDSAEYKEGNRVRYDGVLYKVLQDHTSQSDWKPDETSSLYAKVLIPDSTVIQEWEQPESTNGYMIGDKVTHDGVTYESLVDNNVWEPGATGTEGLWKTI